MAFDVGALVSKLKLDSGGFNASVDTAKLKAGSLGDKIAGAGAKFKVAGTAMTVAGAAIVGSLTILVNRATDAAETASKFATIFQTEMPKARAAVADLTKNYGLSTNASKEMLSATGDLLTGMGMQAGTALDLSLKTQQLAVDLASFTNYSGGAIGASNALTKAMLGERESLKGLGKTVTEEMVKAELARVGKTRLTGASLLQAKAEATLEIVMRQSATALGDYERTSDSLANKKRELNARLEDIVVTLGTYLIPIFAKVATEITTVITKVSDWMNKNPQLTETIMKIALAAGGLLTVLGPIVIILPKIAAGMATVKKAGVGFAGSFKGMNEQVGGLSGGLKKLPAIGAAAFVGWKVGRLIGEITGLDGAIQGAFEKLGIFNKYAKGTKTELGEGSKALNLAAKRQDQMAEASKIAGREITNYNEALKILGKVTYTKVIPAQKEATEGAVAYSEAVGDTEDAVESLSDFLKTEGIKTIKEKNKRVEELEKHLGELTEAYEDGTITLDDYTEASETARDELEGLTSELDGTRKSEKLLTDYLQDEGIPTIEEKDERVNDLRDVLILLEKAYKDGRISLEDFTRATANAKRELENLSTTVVTTAIPAARDFNDVIDLAPAEFEDLAFSGKEAATDITTTWGSLTDGLKTKWASAFGEMLRGQGGFKLDLKGMWDSIYTQFTDILGSMFSDFLAGGKNAFAGLSAALTSPAGFIAAVYLGVNALWDIGEALSDFLMGAGLNANWQEQKDRLDEYRQKWLDLGYSVEEANERYNEWLRLTGQGGDSGAKAPGLPPGIHDTPSGPRDRNRPPRGSFAIGGITAPYPHAVDVGEKYEREYIVPESKLMSLVGKIMDIGSGAGGTGRNSPVFNLNMSPTVQLMGTISGAGFDPTALQAQIRGTIVPQILQDLLSNLQKSEWQKALGLI